MLSLLSLFLGPTFFMLSGIWILLRLGLFCSERIDIAPVYPEFYLCAAWLLRILLLVTGGVVAGWGLFFTYFGFSAGPTLMGPDKWALWTALATMTLYGFGAFIMNFPFFPLRLHRRLFYFVQLLLLPCLALCVYLQLFLLPLAFLFVYLFLWRQCLSDRVKYKALIAA